MAEYIEREALLATLKPDEPGDDRAAVLLCDVKRLLREFAMMLPAADVVEVVHARWETIPGTKSRKHCTNCDFSGPEYIKFYSHCPNCGAKMDGE